MATKNINAGRDLAADSTWGLAGTVDSDVAATADPPSENNPTVSSGGHILFCIATKSRAEMHMPKAKGI